MKNAGLKIAAIVFVGYCCFVVVKIYSLQSAPQPGSVEAISAAAHDALHDQDYAVAIDQFTRALAQNPNDAVLHGGLGLALARGGRGEDAIAEFRECLRLDPARADIAKQLGKTLFELDRFREAKSQFEAVVEDRPDDVEAYQWLFTINNQLSEQLDNLPVLEKLAELRPDEPQYVYAQIMIYHQNNQIDQALRTFETLPAAEQETVKGRYVLASVYYKNEDYSQALELLEQVLKDDPEHAEAKKLLEQGTMLAEHARQFKQELASINEAIAANPDDPELYFQRGVALIKSSRPDEAKQEFQECLTRLDPEQTDVVKRLGKSLVAFKQFDLAQQYLELIADDAEDMEIYELLLAISSSRNKPLENLPILKKMAALDPEEPKYVTWQLGIYLENNQPQGALKALKQLPQEQQEQLKNQYILGVIYYQLKDFARAIEVLEKVVSADPENADAKKILELCRAELRN